MEKEILLLPTIRVQSTIVDNIRKTIEENERLSQEDHLHRISILATRRLEENSRIFCSP